MGWRDLLQRLHSFEDLPSSVSRGSKGGKGKGPAFILSSSSSSFSSFCAVCGYVGNENNEERLLSLMRAGEINSEPAVKM
jgi:hypothetical protein